MSVLVGLILLLPGSTATPGRWASPGPRRSWSRGGGGTCDSAEGDREARKQREDGHAEFAEAGWRGVTDRLERGGTQALDLIDALLEAALAYEDGAGQVGAGPLEHLLHEHGVDLLGEVERRARRDAPFRQALSQVWLEDGVLDAEVQRRLEPWVTVMGRGERTGRARHRAVGRRPGRS